MNIDKGYKRRQLELHPDKRRRRRIIHDDDDDDDATLQKVREDYDILKDDNRRLLYHRFGIRDVKDAVDIISGAETSSSKRQRQLLRLMGYGGSPPPATSSFSPTKNSCDSRITFITADLVERLRPLVEGVISQDHLVYYVMTECESLKRLPLGAPILRCVGRVYRHAGQRYLRRYADGGGDGDGRRRRRWETSVVEAREKARETLRNTKYFLTAVVASGRWMMRESAVTARRSNSTFTFVY